MSQSWLTSTILAGQKKRPISFQRMETPHPPWMMSTTKAHRCTEFVNESKGSTNEDEDSTEESCCLKRTILRVADSDVNLCLLLENKKYYLSRTGDTPCGGRNFIKTGGGPVPTLPPRGHPTLKEGGSGGSTFWGCQFWGSRFFWALRTKKRGNPPCQVGFHSAQPPHHQGTT